MTNTTAPPYILRSSTTYPPISSQLVASGRKEFFPTKTEIAASPDELENSLSPPNGVGSADFYRNEDQAFCNPRENNDTYFKTFHANSSSWLDDVIFSGVKFQVLSGNRGLRADIDSASVDGSNHMKLAAWPDYNDASRDYSNGKFPTSTINESMNQSVEGRTFTAFKYSYIESNNSVSQQDFDANNGYLRGTIPSGVASATPEPFNNNGSTAGNNSYSPNPSSDNRGSSPSDNFSTTTPAPPTVSTQPPSTTQPPATTQPPSTTQPPVPGSTSPPTAPTRPGSVRSFYTTTPRPTCN